MRKVKKRGGGGYNIIVIQIQGRIRGRFKMLFDGKIKIYER
jgi:hypothetical protein